MERIVAIVACALLPACAGTDVPRTQSSYQQRCVVEPPIGSNIRVTKCFDRETDGKNKRDVKEFEEDARRGPARNGNLATGGG
jgi:hypothetical protein